MNCATAREQLLTAELTPIRSGTASELSRHLDECDRCRSIAAVLLTAQQELHLAIEAPHDADATEAARNAVITAARRRTRRRFMRRAVPLAIAASLATLLLNRRAPSPHTEIPRPRAGAAPGQVRVTAPLGRSVAVIETDNPNVVIIWFF
jgi:anti-sigma factor RsiW